MLQKLDKRENTPDIHFEPNEGERTLLSSNKGGMRSPSLDLEDTLTDETMLLEQFADILVDIFLAHEDARFNKQKGSHLLPGINKRTG